MNVCVFIGRITARPELKQTTTGKFVTGFDIAVKRPHTSDVTDFIKVVAWNKTADFITRYFDKGQMIAIRGHLTQREYTDRDGNKRYAFEVICDEADFCGSKEDGAGKPANNAEALLKTIGELSQPITSAREFEELSPDDDDLPF